MFAGYVFYFKPQLLTFSPSLTPVCSLIGSVSRVLGLASCMTCSITSHRSWCWSAAAPPSAPPSQRPLACGTLWWWVTENVLYAASILTVSEAAGAGVWICGVMFPSPPPSGHTFPSLRRLARGISWCFSGCSKHMHPFTEVKCLLREYDWLSLIRVVLDSWVVSQIWLDSDSNESSQS